MSLVIPYSAKKVDLYYPCKNAQFFPDGKPASEAALCVELARLAYCRNESDFAFDQEKVRIVLAGIGFPYCEFFEANRHNTQGPHGFLTVREDRQLAVLAFRGTDKDDPRDIAHDINAKLHHWPEGGRVHSGFAHALGEIRQVVDQALDRLSCRILFTGHSLGAAMGTLLASARRPDALYTFGSPRVGDDSFVATLKGVEGHRYVDCCDVVPRISLQGLLGYAHVGKPYYIDRDRNLAFDPAADLVARDQFEASLHYFFRYAWKPGNVWARELADHAPVNYVGAVQ